MKRIGSFSECRVVRGSSPAGWTDISRLRHRRVRTGSSPVGWTDHWDTLCTCIAETFRFTETERIAFERNKTAQLIAALPFAAGCDEPERTALAHLAVYMTEIRGGSSIGGHTPGDNESIFARLRLIASFKGGNPAVITHGMNKLALIMVQGYKRSKEEDALRGVYNPLNDCSWNAEELKVQLISGINAFPCEILDSILPEGEEVIPWL